MEDLCKGCSHMHLCVARNKILAGYIMEECPCRKCLIKVMCSVGCPEYKIFFQPYKSYLRDKIGVKDGKM